MYKNQILTRDGENFSQNIKLVMIATSHPGNIGAAARAMKNMGLHQLTLVTPKIFPHVDATARASGADDILATAQVVGSMEEAIADCALVVGTSARARDLPIEVLSPRQAAAQVVSDAKAGSKVAVVFGRESNGLSNTELRLCHYHIHIPTDPEFSSLNVAAAVQILAYEIMLAATTEEICGKLSIDEAQTLAIECDYLAPNIEIAQFYAHLEQVLLNIGFLKPHNPRKLMERLRRMFNRARLRHLETNALRGILKAIEQKKP